jgi:hypothetical protein
LTGKEHIRKKNGKNGFLPVSYRLSSSTGCFAVFISNGKNPGVDEPPMRIYPSSSVDDKILKDWDSNLM